VGVKVAAEDAAAGAVAVRKGDVLRVIAAAGVHVGAEQVGDAGLVDAEGDEEDA